MQNNWQWRNDMTTSQSFLFSGKTPPAVWAQITKIVAASKSHHYDTEVPGHLMVSARDFS